MHVPNDLTQEAKETNETKRNETNIDSSTKKRAEPRPQLNLRLWSPRLTPTHPDDWWSLLTPVIAPVNRTHPDHCMWLTCRSCGSRVAHVARTPVEHGSDGRRREEENAFVQQHGLPQPQRVGVEKLDEMRGS